MGRNAVSESNPVEQLTPDILAFLDLSLNSWDKRDVSFQHRPRVHLKTLLPPLKHSTRQITFNVNELTGLIGVDLAAVAMNVEWDNNLRCNQLIDRRDSLPPSLVIPLQGSYFFRCSAE